MIENQTFWLSSLFKAILLRKRRFWSVNERFHSVQEDKSILETFPWWKDFLKHITNNASFSELQMLICGLQNYFHTEDLSLHNMTSNMTPLMWALNKDSSHLRFLEYFLDSPLKVMDDFEERRFGYWYNPFVIACSFGFVQSAKLILKFAKKQSIDISQKDKPSNALHYACLCGKLNAVQFLLENKDEIGIDVNQVDRDLISPLHEAVHADHDASVSMDDRKQVVQFILENRNVYGINANLRDGDGLTPMALASKQNLHEIVQIFRNHGFENDENIE